MFLTLAFYLAPALFKGSGGEQQRPHGKIFEWLDSFILPDPSDATIQVAESNPGAGKSAFSGRLTWVGKLDAGLQQAKEKDKLVFIDFTGLT